MAITRAQQVKQMLREGGRIGLRNGSYDEAGLEVGPGGGSTYDEAGLDVAGSAADRGSYDAPTGAVDDPFKGPGQSPDYFTTTNLTGYDEETNVNTPPTGGGGDENNNVVGGGGDGSLQTLYNEGVPESNFPGILGFASNFLRDFRNKGLRKNIDYFRELQARGRLQDYPQTVDGYRQYLEDRLSGKITASGNPGSATRDNDPALSLFPQKNILDPDEKDDNDEEDQTTDIFAGIAPRIAGSIFDFDKLRRQLEEQSAADGGRIGADEGGIMKASYGYDDAMGEAFEEFLRLKKIKEIPEDMEFDEYLDQLDIDVPYSRKDRGKQRTMAQEGGIMDFETGRQMYFLGKLVKKATRAVKKVAKSPLGKAALGIAAIKFGPAFLKSEGLKKFFLTDPSKGFSLGNLIGKNLTTGGAMAGIAGISALAGLMPQEEEEDDPYRGPDIDIANIRANPYNFLAPRFTGTTFAADGGLMRMGYQEGSKEPVASKTMPLLDMDGKEMDLRDNGGFVPIGRMEKADDVPARLSKNEFVFTADAVRNAGEGDVDKGAEVMYNMMKNLESGGEVSEESQGLQGARDMFQTSKRLEEVL